jgi:hypothetical protein
LVSTMKVKQLANGFYQLPSGQTLSPDTYLLNRDLLEAKPKDTELFKQIKKEKAKANREVNRNKFNLLWGEYGEGIILVEEHHFHPTRRFSSDYAHVESKTSVELEGGTGSRYTKSRHTTPQGFKGDREKYLAATALGWVVISLTSDMITVENIETIVSTIKQRSREYVAG